MAIRFDRVSKAYDLQVGRYNIFSALKSATGRPVSNELFYALSEVTFDVESGQTVGVIGRNGSGKSTMLKLIAGITSPSEGTVRVDGRVSSLIELGAGFHPELTGRENIYMNAAILGIPSKLIDQRLGEIIGFAELGEFIDVPVKRYSSGMYARLGFAVASNIDPDILIVDEALAVGDIKFQRKCFAKIEDIRKQNKTVMFVSHSLDTVNFICNRAILVENGRILRDGEPKSVSRAYQRLLFGEDARMGEDIQDPLRPLATLSGLELHAGGVGADAAGKFAGRLSYHRKQALQRASQKMSALTNPKVAEIIDCIVYNCEGDEVTLVKTGKKYLLVMRVLFYQPATDIHLGFVMNTVKGVPVFWTNTIIQKTEIPPQERGDILEAQFDLEMKVAPGDYFIGFGVRPFDGSFYYDRKFDLIHLRVQTDSNSIGSGSITDLGANVNICSSRTWEHQ